jgi:hypothetical protein
MPPAAHAGAFLAFVDNLVVISLVRFFVLSKMNSFSSEGLNNLLDGLLVNLGKIVSQYVKFQPIFLRLRTQADFFLHQLLLGRSSQDIEHDFFQHGRLVGRQIILQHLEVQRVLSETKAEEK